MKLIKEIYFYRVKKRFYFYLFFPCSFGDSSFNEPNFYTKLETIQVENQEKMEKTPLRVVILLIKNPLFLESIQSWSEGEWLESLRDFELFRTNIIYHLALEPILINLVNKGVSRKILVHHNGKSIVGIALVGVSPTGAYLVKLIIPSADFKNTEIKNIIFTIRNNSIKARPGFLGKFS